MTDRERAILNHYYLDDMTLQEVGDIYGLTRQRISVLILKHVDIFIGRMSKYDEIDYVLSGFLPQRIVNTLAKSDIYTMEELYIAIKNGGLINVHGVGVKWVAFFEKLIPDINNRRN